MDFMATVSLITGIFSLTFMLNLYFGHLRSRSRKYSLQWFLYIHVPIPFVVIARVLSHLDLRYIPIFVCAAITGQILGGRLDF